MSDEYHLMIGGDRTAGADGTYEIVNPATEEVVAVAPQASASQAADAVAAARGAFDAWAATKPEERAELLDRVADLIERDREALIELTIAETGATRRTSTNIQVPQAAARFRRYARGAMEPTVSPISSGSVIGVDWR